MWRSSLETPSHEGFNGKFMELTGGVLSASRLWLSESMWYITLYHKVMHSIWISLRMVGGPPSRRKMQTAEPIETGNLHLVGCVSPSSAWINCTNSPTSKVWSRMLPRRSYLRYIPICRSSTIFPAYVIPSCFHIRLLFDSLDQVLILHIVLPKAWLETRPSHED